jgi:predicted amidohydrolase
VSGSADQVLLGIAQQRVQRPQSLAHALELFESRVAAAVSSGAQLLVFPEYGALELTALQDEATRADLARSLLALQAVRSDFLRCFAQLAVRHQICILAPSFPWLLADSDGAAGPRYVNRAWWCAPTGVAWQDKLNMTRFEAEHWGISAASDLQVFECQGVRVGVQICYDSEFPQASRRLYEAGVGLLLVPSCTDAWAGYQRVRTGCKARALEGQMLVAQAPLRGAAPWSPAIDVNCGRAALYAPSDRGFPASGVVARATDRRAEWLIVEADFAALRALRADPQVWNGRDGGNQQRAEAGPARLIPLSAVS